MSARRAAILVLPFLLALSGCGGSTAPGDGALISFTRFHPDGSNIFTIGVDGATEQQITSGSDVAAHASWTAHGDVMAYTRISATGSTIQTLRVDTRETATLTPANAWSMVPSFSPDTSRIAYTSSQDGNFEVYTMARDGSDVRQLTFSDPPVSHVGPKYAPDGQTIVYAKRLRDEDADQDLYLMRTDGTRVRRITHGINNVESRSWSPDGARIVFNHVVDGVGQLFVVQADGSGLTRLTFNAGRHPAFEPGGIFPVMRGDITPAWSPDGAWIAYASDADGDFDLYLIRPDGTEKRQITNTPAHELSVGWRPMKGQHPSHPAGLGERP